MENQEIKSRIFLEKWWMGGVVPVLIARGGGGNACHPSPPLPVFHNRTHTFYEHIIV
jgi:hypothetical protein